MSARLVVMPASAVLRVVKAETAPAWLARLVLEMSTPPTLEVEMVATVTEIELAADVSPTKTCSAPFSPEVLKRFTPLKLVCVAMRWISLLIDVS